jgi:hypothetical protein
MIIYVVLYDLTNNFRNHCKTVINEVGNALFYLMGYLHSNLIPLHFCLTMFSSGEWAGGFHKMADLFQ